MDVRQALDVEATFPRRVFAELVEQFRMTRLLDADIESDVLFARRKRDQHPIGFATVSVLYFAGAESDDTGPPHLRLGLCGLFHDFCDDAAIAADLFVLDCVDEGIDGYGCEFCLEIGHGRR